MIISCDPGSSGAICLFDSETVSPVLTKPTRNPGNLEQVLGMADPTKDHFIIEKVHATGAMRGPQAFAFGQATGIVKGFAWARGWHPGNPRYNEVTPHEWQKRWRQRLKRATVGLSERKAYAIRKEELHLIARELHPNFEAAKAHADAILIAHYQFTLTG